MYSEWSASKIEDRKIDAVLLAKHVHCYTQLTQLSPTLTLPKKEIMTNLSHVLVLFGWKAWYV